MAGQFHPTKNKVFLRPSLAGLFDNITNTTAKHNTTAKFSHTETEKDRERLFTDERKKD